MQTYVYATPLVVSGGLAVLGLVAGRERSIESGSVRAFYVPSVYCRFVAGVALACLAVPFIPSLQGDASAFFWYGFFALLSGGFSAFALYLRRYRVTVGTEGFSVRGLMETQYLIVDIASARPLMAGGGGRAYEIRMRNGKKLQFSGLLTDFDTLVDLLHVGPNHLMQPTGRKRPAVDQER